jgi:ubiquitin-protein ligase
MDIKRIQKDIGILNKNLDDLNARDIYFDVDEQDIHNINILIIGKEYPYKGGFFLFEFKIPNDFPLSPPKIIFNPQQNFMRLHPNFYECGKVCLSVINTWGGQDWTPSMSLLSLISVLEARFNDKPLCFEPSLEMSGQSAINEYNKLVQYGVYNVAILDVLKNKYKIYENFNNIIKIQFLKKKQEYIDTVKNIAPFDSILPYFNRSRYNIKYKNIIDNLNLMW